MPYKLFFNDKKERLHLRTILFLAEQLEIRAEAMYGAFAEKIADPAVRDTCLFLAKEEQRHARNLATVLNHWKSIPDSEKDPRTFPQEADRITRAFLSDPPPVSDPATLLRFALEQENKSIEMFDYFQTRLSEEFTLVHERYAVSDEARLEWKLSQLDEMIEEERRHKKIIEGFLNTRV